MKICGIVCEYNPFHNGHKRQFSMIRHTLGEDTAIVCIMSGNYVQRGMPAIFDKTVRAKAAIAAGADLVLELPITYAVSSAEGFASGAVRFLSPFCDYLCFGAERTDRLMETASALLQPEFSSFLRTHLDQGLSFPAARVAALEDMHVHAADLTQPNIILAVEYCKAILQQNSAMEILPVLRNGSYHDTVPQTEAPSATALRGILEQNGDCAPFIPAESLIHFRGNAIHAHKFGERAILARLRTMTDAEFEALPYGSEGLWRKLMHNSRSLATLEEILTATKSKRYTRTRLDRCVLCAFLGITEEMMKSVAPYARVLAFNDGGRAVLKKARTYDSFINAGEETGHPYEALEVRSDALYSLFSEDPAEKPDLHKTRRIAYLPKM